MKTRLLVIGVLVWVIGFYLLGYVAFCAADAFNLVSINHGVGYALYLFYQPILWVTRMIAKLLYNH